MKTSFITWPLLAGFAFTMCAPSAVVAQPVSRAAAPPSTVVPPECRDEQGLTYSCGLVVPEDIVRVGSTGLLLVSGHRVPGSLYLVDPAAGTPLELIHGATFMAEHDTRAYPDCPGPLNLQAFDVHGLSVTELSRRRFSVFTTSHGAREAIEIYELDLRGTAPLLTWKGCVLLQQDGYFNSVARLPDGGFVTTRMRDANARSHPMGRVSGQVFEWHPGGPLQPIAGTELSWPNGIDVSQDGRYIFVAASGSNEVVRFDRHMTPIGKRAVTLPVAPDNIHWGSNGKLVTVGSNVVAPEARTGPDVGTGWSVLEIDPATLAFSRLGGADHTATLRRASSAMRVNDEVWVGSLQDRIARFSVKRF